jgi:hypothetical protein
MRALLFVCFALSACASPVLVNPSNPAADLQADTAACEKDAERIGRLHQISGQAAGSCITGPACMATADTQRIRVATEALAAQKQCMKARGWRQVN